MRAARIVVIMWASAGCGEVVGDDTPDPDVAQVSISPSEPKTADDLVATSTPSGLTLRWTKNGTVREDVSGSTVGASLTSKGETWGVDVVSSTGTVIGHDEVVIGNTGPTAPTIEVQLTAVPNTPVPCAVVTQATDPDGDTLQYSATWLRNGVAYAGATMTMFAGDTVPMADHAAGDGFECTVVASDGTEMVTARAGARVLVQNGSPPNGTLQMFTMPAVASIRIEAAGARGATQGTSANGTHGAIMRGTFSPTPGTVLTIAVGQSPTGSNLAGGGGTFVIAPGNAPLLIAGGGGSMFGGAIPVAESVGRIETSGGTAGATLRSDNGLGGRILTGSNSGAGGGMMGNGAGATGGQSYLAGAMGGGVASENAWGGFGGGGGRAGLYGQGGGGGYSGGSCGDGPSTWAGCGGGGSINNGTDQNNSAGANAETGYVKITW